MRTRLFIMVLVMLLPGLLLPAAQAQESAIRAVKSLPAPLSGAAAVWDGSGVLVFGGRTPSGATDAILRYDPVANEWTTRAARLPSPGQHLSAVWTGSEALVFGLGDAIVAYDPAADTARTLGYRIPGPRDHAGAAWTGRHAYLFGGTSPTGQALDDVIRVDPAAGTAVRVDAQLEKPAADTSAVWNGKSVLVFAGAPHDDPGISYAFDPATLIMRASHFIGNSRGFATAFDGTHAYVFGGEQFGFGWYASPVRWKHPDGGVRLNDYPFGTGRGYIALAWTGDTAYLVGGENEQGPTSSVVRYKPSLIPGSAQPKPVAMETPAPAPTPLPAAHADLPTFLSIWGTGGAVRGTGARCDSTDPGGDLHVQTTTTVLDFEGQVVGGADGGQTGRWGLLAMHAPTEVQCSGRSVALDGSTRSDLGILVGMNFSRALKGAPTITPLGPGTTFSVDGHAEACRRHGDAVAIAGFSGTLVGRDTAVPAREMPPQSATTAKTGEWDLVIARDVASLQCTTAGVKATGPTPGFSPHGIVVGIRFAPEDRAGAPSGSAPAQTPQDPRLPLGVRWWRPENYAIEGTAGGCASTDPDRRAVTSAILTKFEGTISGADAATGQPLSLTGAWDFVVAAVPESIDCSSGRVRVTGQPREVLGFVAAVDFATPPPPGTSVETLLLGPGTHVSGAGQADACRGGLEQSTLAVAGFRGTLTGRYTRVPPTEIPPMDARSTHEGAWELVLVTPTSAQCSSTGVGFEAGSADRIAMLVAFRAGTPSTPPPVTPAPTGRTPCYDLLSCPLGDVSAIRSRILGVRGQVLTAAGIAVAGAPVLLLGEKSGALDLLGITQTLEDGSFNLPTTVGAPAYAATLLGGHVVLQDLAQLPGGVPPDGLLSLRLPVPPEAAVAQHAQLSAPEVQLLADAFSSAKPFGVPSASPDAPANLPLGGYAGIRGVAIQPASPQQDGRLVVVDLKDKGSPRIPDPPNGANAKFFAVQFADINGTDVPLSRITFEFEAPPGADGKDVILHHFRLDEQRWESVVARRNEAGTYTAAVDSLSLFAVSTSQPSALGALVTTVAASPWTLPMLGGLAVVGIAAVALKRLHVTRAGRPSASAGTMAAVRAAPLPEREALVSDVRFAAKGTAILKGVSFAFAQGEILALLGPSGSGKSTLLKALLGEISYEGEISLFGMDPARRTPEMKRLVGYVSQETELYPDMTLRENVEYFGRQYGLAGAELKERVGPLLATLGLADRAETRVGLLSGGQQRRASIAATLVQTPSLLILDEPTSGLDPVTRKSLWKFVRQASRDLGVTVIVTTHFLDEAELADRVVILNQGAVVRAGTPAELVRSLPGGGRAVVVDLQATSPAIEERAREAVRPLLAAKTVSALDLSGYSARFFTTDAQQATRAILEAFAGAEIPVKQVTTEDCGMDAVFSYYAGERWRDPSA